MTCVIFPNASVSALWSLGQPQRRVNTRQHAAAQQPGTVKLRSYFHCPFPSFIFVWLIRCLVYLHLSPSCIFRRGTPMAGLFWIQLRALIWKNWIILSKHWFVSVHPSLAGFSSNLALPSSTWYAASYSQLPMEPSSLMRNFSFRNPTTYATPFWQPKSSRLTLISTD